MVEFKQENPDKHDKKREELKGKVITFRSWWTMRTARSRAG